MNDTVCHFPQAVSLLGDCFDDNRDDDNILPRPAIKAILRLPHPHLQIVKVSKKKYPPTDFLTNLFGFLITHRSRQVKTISLSFRSRLFIMRYVGSDVNVDGCSEGELTPTIRLGNCLCHNTYGRVLMWVSYGFRFG